MDTLRKLVHTSLAAAVVLTLVLVGCSGQSDDQATPLPSIPDAATSAPPSLSPTPMQTDLPVPPVVDGEAARFVHVADGPDGTPQTTVTALGAIADGEPFRVAGQCIGGSLDYRLVAADPAADGQTLVEGSITCDGEATSEFTYRVAYSGVVQLSLVGQSDLVAGWARVLTGDAE